MLFDTRGKALYWVAAGWISHACAQVVPVIGMTTGIDPVTGQPPSRLDIHVLEDTGGPMWDLFIRGLDALQNMPEEDPRSHFAVAGIHGMPFEPYNGVGPVIGGSGGGYCPHGAQLVVLYRSWLTEEKQVLGAQVQRLALEYNGTDASAYREISQTFRLPYWDWANNPSLPHSAVQENVTVNGPKGPITLHSPLYDYRWQQYPLNATQFPGYGAFGPTTTRNGSDGFDPDIVNSALSAAARTIQDSVYRTFISSTTYDQMASMADSGNSLESPHNLIHNLIGGSYLNLDITSFDSLFILHHCNLDRLAAIWTAVRPNNTYQTTPGASGGLYSTAKGEIITADSPLKPFYQADGVSFHTGLTVQSTVTFGYTYPELVALNHGSGRDMLIEKVNELYGSTYVQPHVEAKVSIQENEWLVDVQVQRGDLPLPCNINVYLGDHLVEPIILLNMPKQGMAHNEISLRRFVDLLYGHLNDPAAVEREIKKNLYAQVVKADGTEVDPDTISSLKVELAKQDITHPGSASEFPFVGNKTMLANVLVKWKGKTVGYS
ncbi:Di-copper centre-containing protein [Xylariaceae sp. FL1272]|nr:Di-copper centre-containing protein [Xylariaceae sp. FL1272]